MLTIHSFNFNPFEENTYILSDETKDCIIVDPGCYTSDEFTEVDEYISENKLIPKFILLTHAHIDHILGNKYLATKYSIPIQMSQIEVPLLHAATEYGKMWGVACELSPEPTVFVEEGKEICFGNTILKTIFTPGHSPGSFSYLHEESKSLLSGDVLFMQSIGRTDLPGGNYATLMRSIFEKLMVLSDDVNVYPGHGPATTIGAERVSNPFLNSY
jgi:hydroxyacylglutathione hydrolase